MQDEVNTKVVAIAIKGGKITGEMLEKALKKFVEEIEKAQKQPLSLKLIGVSSPLSISWSRMPLSATSK